MTKTKKSESQVQVETRLGLSQLLKCVMFRNNVGAFRSPNGQWVRYGLANDSKQMNQHTKSADLIGWTPVVVTSEMVGHTIPVFTSIEVKEQGYTPLGHKQVAHYKAQENWRDSVLRAGGIAAIVDSAIGAVEVVREWLRQFDK